MYLWCLPIQTDSMNSTQPLEVDWMTTGNVFIQILTKNQQQFLQNQGYIIDLVSTFSKHIYRLTDLKKKEQNSNIHKRVIPDKPYAQKW